MPDDIHFGRLPAERIRMRLQMRQDSSTILRIWTHAPDSVRAFPELTESTRR